MTCSTPFAPTMQGTLRQTPWMSYAPSIRLETVSTLRSFRSTAPTACRKRVVSLDDTTRDALVDEHDPIERALSDQRLAKLLQHLTDDQQDVIILKFVQGLENTEVAHVLNKNEGAVKSLQHRALRRLARVMAESHSHQDEERATA